MEPTFTPHDTSTFKEESIEMLIVASLAFLGSLTGLHDFVTVTKLHPILVNFTAALVPVSLAIDLVARLRRREDLRLPGWVTLLVATAITPFTAITGWLFWMDDDVGVTGMTIHKWLGSALVLLLFGLFFWRRHQHRQSRWPGIPYFILGAIFVALLVYQGCLGGAQVFSEM